MSRNQWRYRRIAEKALGRSLRAEEIVHHVNGDPTDDRLENLLVCSRTHHSYLHRNPEGHAWLVALLEEQQGWKVAQ